ncbi:MAG: class I SAM-dependent methyltransferase [Gaiellaceae bacterium]
MPERDQWAEWLAERRYGGDPERAARGLEQLVQWRDRVLDHARLAEGETVLDVGCGEGLVGFGALERGAGTVIFSDVSQDLLDFCREAATELSVLRRSRFLRAPAHDLQPVDSSSVDVVATRSVLIYVEDKESTFREFARVLRPGGRISLFEPINRFARTTADTWAGFDLSPIRDISEKLRAIYEAIQPPDTDPMLDFDERDLVDLAERAGFFPIRLDLEAEIRASDHLSWENFLASAGNPRNSDGCRSHGPGAHPRGAGAPYRSSPPARRGRSRHSANGPRFPPRRQALKTEVDWSAAAR